MSIATRFVSSTARPRLDLLGGVLYAPFWRPDLGGSTFTTIGDNGIPTHLCTVTGAVYGSQGRTLDGTDDIITVPHNAVFNVTNLTAAGWIKVAQNSDIPSSGANIFNKNASGDGLADPFALRLDATTGYLFGRIADTIGQNTITGSVDLSDNKFHFVDFSVDGTNLRLFVDNASAATAVSQTRTPTTNTTDIVLGRWQTVANSFFKGVLGEAMILNRAWTASERARFYDSTKWRYL